jgi:hypothetical protein
MTAVFMKLPAKRQYPDYYKVIKNPTSLTKIKENLHKFKTVRSFQNEFNLMWDNAMQYNLPESQIFTDAAKLKVLLYVVLVLFCFFLVLLDFMFLFIFYFCFIVFFILFYFVLCFCLFLFVLLIVLFYFILFYSILFYVFYFVLFSVLF